MKIGIIRCQEHSNDCAGFSCFPAMREKSGEFEKYKDKEIELVGFDTCGGCGRNKADKIISKAQRLKEKGAEVIHLGNCMVGACPSKDMYKEALEKEVGLPFVENTHGRPNRPPKKD
ncbi:CGGC domain-containing protein [Chloroflexota bacterium]